MNEDEARAHVDSLLDCQRMLIARATLAGCKFEPRTQREWIGHKSRGKVDVTYYEAWLPDGTWVGRDFRDLYEAACTCVSVLDAVPSPISDAFQLTPDNEQPQATMTNNDTRRWPWEKL